MDMSTGQTYHRRSTGFTIVELLIVIIVIAILATITIVSYNGIQARAMDAKRAQAASNAAKGLMNYYQITSSFPDDSACIGEVSHYPAATNFAQGLCYKEVNPTTGSTARIRTVEQLWTDPMKTTLSSIPDGSYSPVIIRLENGNDLYARGVVGSRDAMNSNIVNLYIYSANDNFTCPSGGVKSALNNSGAIICTITLRMK